MKIKSAHSRRWGLFGPISQSTYTVVQERFSDEIPTGITVRTRPSGEVSIWRNDAGGVADWLREVFLQLVHELRNNLRSVASLEISNARPGHKLQIVLVYGQPIREANPSDMTVNMLLRDFEARILHS